MKKLIALLLAVIALTLLLAACGEDGSKATEPTQAITQTDTKGETVPATDAAEETAAPADRAGEKTAATDAADPAPADNANSKDNAGSADNSANTHSGNTSKENDSDSSGNSGSETTAPDDAPTEDVEGEIPVIIVEIPSDEDLIELPDL